MKVSVITPSLNQVLYIRRSITSVISQNYKNIELIIIDGKSSDNTIQVLREFGNDINFWVSELDSGQSEAINKGIKLAHGDIINWLNADDYYEPGALQILVKSFELKKVKVVIGRSRIFEGEQTIQYSRGTDIYLNNLNKTIGWARIDQPATFFCKEAWDKVGFLNEMLHFTLDREWWMRYLYCFGLNGIRKIDDVLVNFRLHKQSKTISSSDKFQIEHDTIFYILATLLKDRKFEDLLLSNLNIDLSIDSEIKKWTDKSIILGSFNYYLLKKAEELYYQGEHEASRDFLKQINPNFIADEDQFLLNKIKFRSKFPKFIVSLFRK